MGNKLGRRRARDKRSLLVQDEAQLMLHRGLPPLGFLPAFEAAGRLGSFKAAAHELHVTASAISQQIKGLEEAIGTTLFERLGHAVRLSQEGKEYLRDVERLLLELRSATRRLRQHEERDVLRVSTVDFVAYELLIPRLPAFRVRFKELELRVSTSTKVVALNDDEFDAALRMGGGPFEGMTSIPVGPLVATLVCSPKLARGLRTPTDVLKHPLIELRGQEYRGFHAVVKQHGALGKQAEILTLETYFETMCAAEQGVGIAIGLFPLTTSWVLSGRLAVPLAAREVLPGGAQFVHRAGDTRAELGAVGAWLQQQYAELTPLPSGRVVKKKPR